MGCSVVSTPKSLWKSYRFFAAFFVAFFFTAFFFAAFFFAISSLLRLLCLSL